MEPSKETPNPQSSRKKRGVNETPQNNKNINSTPTPGDNTKETPGNQSTDLIVNNYVLINQIGRGAFGEIFLSFNLRDNIEVAVKREQKRIGKSVQLKIEAKVYQSLLNISQNQDLTGAIALPQETIQGVPKYYGVGELPDATGYYLIMEFLGPNLNELFKFCGMRKFTISTTCLLAIQIINRIENVHKHNFIHRDIKPENFMIGSQSSSNIIYLVDFGLSRRYKNAKNNQHIPYREGRNLIGTARYVSVNTHLGIEQSRRDDLESIGYVLIFFLKGYLPWQGMKGGDKYQRIMEKKLQIPIDILCLGLPEEMTVFMNYVKGLKFEDRPDYDFLRGLFIKMLSKCVTVFGIEKEYLKFDWSFEDPKNSIWQLYQDKNNKKTQNYSYSESKGLNSSISNDVTKENNASTLNKKNKNFSVIQGGGKLKRDLTEINEAADNEKNEGFDKTTENNPNASGGDDDDEDEDDSKEKTIEDKEENNCNNNEQKTPDGDNNNNNNINKNDNEYVTPKGETVITNHTAITNNRHETNEHLSKTYSKQNKKNEDTQDYRNVQTSVKSKQKPKEEIKETQSIKQNTKTNRTTKDNNNNNNNINNQANNNDDNEASDATVDEEFSPNNLEMTTSIPNHIENVIKECIQPKDMKIDSYIIKLSKGEATKNQPSSNTNNNNSISINPPSSTNQIQIHQNTKVKDSSYEFEQSKCAINSQLDDTPPLVCVTPDFKDAAKNDDAHEIENRKDYYTTLMEEGAKLQKEFKHDDDEDEKEPESSVRPKNIEERLQAKEKEAQKKVDEMTRKAKPSLIDFPQNEINMRFSKENLIKIKREPITRLYNIQSDIGQGSYGKVKRVRHKRICEYRAMKIISKQSESAVNEIEILRRISHPNIMNIYEIFEDKTKYYIITEMLDGGELFEFITNQGSFLEKDASGLMKQILQGVNYLHSNNIIHRDLKPENIMLVAKPSSYKRPSLKIIDFGTAISFVAGARINKFIGTNYYIAPEVIAENYNEKCDIWSCGVILYILLCGYPPFNGSSNVDIFHNIQYSEPMFTAEEWKDVSPSAIDLIKKMLDKNPFKRYNAEQCLSHKWFKDNEMDDPFGLKSYNKKYTQLKAVNKMAEFVKENKFKQAVLQFITTQFDIQQEEENLREVFKQFDVEGTGQITKKVFYKELVKLYGEEDAKALTNKIFHTLDLDGNGDISYNEFLTSIIDSKKFITNDRLDKAFRLFDKDGNGKLSIDEIRLVFGGDEEKWKEIIEDIDLNADGEVDFEEFKQLMAGSREIIEENRGTQTINKK